MAANRAARRLLYRSPLCARALFGTWLEPCDDLSFFELCTVVMRRALARDLRPGMRVLEVGTGPYAVLSLWAVKRFGVDIVGTEIEPSWAERARKLAARNGTRLEIRTTDIVAGVDGPFDAVWFVPPFISRSRFDDVVASGWTGDARTLELLALRSVGGEEGSELIARFYADVVTRLSERGRTYVAYNNRHVDDERVTFHARAAGLRVTSSVGLGPLPFRVQVAERPA